MIDLLLIGLIVVIASIISILTGLSLLFSLILTVVILVALDIALEHAENELGFQQIENVEAVPNRQQLALNSFYLLRNLLGLIIVGIVTIGLFLLDVYLETEGARSVLGSPHQIKSISALYQLLGISGAGKIDLIMGFTMALVSVLLPFVIVAWLNDLRNQINIAVRQPEQRKTSILRAIEQGVLLTAVTAGFLTSYMVFNRSLMISTIARYFWAYEWENTQAFLDVGTVLAKHQGEFVCNLCTMIPIALLICHFLVAYIFESHVYQVANALAAYSIRQDFLLRRLRKAITAPLSNRLARGMEHRTNPSIPVAQVLAHSADNGGENPSNEQNSGVDSDRERPLGNPENELQPQTRASGQLQDENGPMLLKVIGGGNRYITWEEASQKPDIYEMVEEECGQRRLFLKSN